jgi:ubiquitin-activating enzyme E1
MGLACSPKGLISITDNDHIELSNLNRQFLYRNKHIGENKSVISCEEAAKINPKLNTKSYESLVSPDTEEFFDDKFWNSQDYIVNAVDNQKARLYIDSKCVLHHKALFDSGTLGTKANTQLVLPGLTECYGDHQDPDEDSIPMCTLRNFPNQIEHCIEWGRARFSELFTEKPTNLRAYLNDREAYIEKLKKDGTEMSALKELKFIKQLLFLEDFEDCVGFAKQRFFEDHDLQIQSLINLFPEKHKDSDGNPFWTGPKRFPKPVEFDEEDELHMDYIVA